MFYTFNKYLETLYNIVINITFYIYICVYVCVCVCVCVNTCIRMSARVLSASVHLSATPLGEEGGELAQQH